MLTKSRRSKDNGGVRDVQRHNAVMLSAAKTRLEEAVAELHQTGTGFGNVTFTVHVSRHIITGFDVDTHKVIKPADVIR